MNAIQSLVEWSQSKGADVPSNVHFIEIGNDNLGAKAEPSDSILVKVPVDTILKLSDAMHGLQFNAEPLVKKPRNINAFSKLFLARERAPNHLSLSMFGAYIASLPTSKQINSPYVWLDERQRELHGSNLGSSLKENLYGLIEEWWLVILLLPEEVKKPESHFLCMKFYYEYKFYETQQLHEYLIGDQHENWTSFPAYLWALMIYKSRSFPSKLLQPDLKVDKINFIQDDVAILIPVIDLINHNPRTQVTWGVSNHMFELTVYNHPGGQLYNNYGQKGNEELLLAYGFCIEENPADSVALKIKVPLEMLPQLELQGVRLPQISDYTTSVINDNNTVGNEILALSILLLYDQYKDGLVFLIRKTIIPDSLILVFQWLVKSRWEDNLTLRMRLSGLNHLRHALESKRALIGTAAKKASSGVTYIYLSGQKAILRAAITTVKQLENTLMNENKEKIVTLKSVYEKDVKFAQSLMLTLGVTCYNDILEQALMDQVWLLYLIRCYNREQYIENEERYYLPLWIHNSFVRMDSETDIGTDEVLQFRDLYENLVIPMNRSVPEIFNVGKWTVRELIVSTKLLDAISFVRGKKQECVLVDDFEHPLK